MNRMRSPFPAGLKPGDFIQFVDNFGDIYFEVLHASAPGDGYGWWSVTYVHYEKYGSRPLTAWENSAGTGIRHVIPAEMAIPTIIAKRCRFHAKCGRYDPFYGYAPAGTQLRKKEKW